MKKKEEIKKEIYDLAKKISAANSDDLLLETARELYEKSVVLKHFPNHEPETAVKPEPQSTVPDNKQTVIDLFSVSENVQTETSPALPVSEKGEPNEQKTVKKQADKSVGEKLKQEKITDLKTHIGINEKFQFINELFGGNMKEYNVAVDQINNFSSDTEAESYIANLEDIYKWNADNHIASNFKELVSRRFA